MRYINCKHCKDPFETQNNNKEFCNKECWKQWKKRNNTSSYPENRNEKHTERECASCHGTYFGSHRTKYCSDGCREDITRHNKWGIPTKELREFRLSHDKICAICNTSEEIVLDHCHETMVIRGWLCRIHNAAIGQLGDNLEGVQRAVNYLK